MNKQEKAVINAAVRWRAWVKRYHRDFGNRSYKAVKVAVARLEASCDALMELADTTNDTLADRVERREKRKPNAKAK